jgi:hypothetical protein
MRAMRRTLALAALVLATAPAAGATTPRLTAVAAFPTVTTAASAAWQDRSGATHVLRDDQPLGGETVLHPPAGCVVGGLTASDVAYGCPTDKPDFVRVWLQDRRTEALRSSPIGFQQGGGAGQFYELRGIGSKLGGIFTSGGPHVDASTEYRRLADGRGIAPPRPSAHRVVSLDAASGTVRLCAPLSVGTHVEEGVDEVNGEYADTVSDRALYVAPWLATIHRGRVLLKRCGSHRVRDLGEAYGDDDDTLLFLTHRYVAWASTASIASLQIHRLSRHVTTHYAPPLGPGSGPIAATDRRLWLRDPAGEAYVMEP